MLKRNNEHELTILRVLQWLHDLTADLKETILTSQDVYQTSINYISHDNTVSNWITPGGPLCVPECNLDLLDPGRSTKTSMDIFRLTESTCTLAITTDVSFKTSLAADSKGGDKNIEFL